MGSLSRILVVEPPQDPLGKTLFLARKISNIWGDCPANQLASPSPQASLFRAAYAFRGYVAENALTEKTWEDAVPGLSRLSNGRSLYQPEKTADISRGNHGQWWPRQMSAVFFRVVLQHLEIWLPTRRLSLKMKPFVILVSIRFTVNQVFFLSV